MIYVKCCEVQKKAGCSCAREMVGPVAFDVKGTNKVLTSSSVFCLSILSAGTGTEMPMISLALSR